MTGFGLDKNNDILISNNQIQMINGSELTTQTVKTLIGTKLEEWCLNASEGITFRNILGKNTPDEDMIKNEIEQGLSQIDSSFVITSFAMNFDNSTRKLSVAFQAKNSENEAVDIENTFG